jgi:hypothetical protein
MQMNQKSQRNNNSDLYRYAGMGAQMLAVLAAAVFIGLKLDQWLKISPSLLVIILPVISLIGLFYKVLRDTSKRKDNNEKK